MLAVKGIAEIITVHGYINVDFADVLSVMTGGGIAFMGSAEASGHDRASVAIEKTIQSPLLNNNDITGARKVLLNITSGTDEITVDEVGIITDRIIREVGGNVNTIWGTCVDETLGDNIRITLVATGFEEACLTNILNQKAPEKTRVPLERKPEPAPVKIEKPAVIPLEDLEKEPENTQEEEPIDDIQMLNQPDELVVVRSEVVKPMPESVKPAPAYDPFFEEDERERLKAERLKALSFTHMSDPEQVDELEKIPAFKRKQGVVQRNMFEESETKSRYTIGGNNQGLRPNNPFLHDAVD